MNKIRLLLCLTGVLFILAFSAFNSSSYLTRKHFSGDTVIPFIIKAKDHKARSVVTTQGTVTLTTGLHNDFYQVDSLRRTGYFYLETRISKFISERQKRVPLNLSVVIDRSGSMQGIKLGYAKKAAREIINQLSPEDWVSIVMYDNAVDSVQPPVPVIDKLLIQSRIDKITPRGATDLWGGTEKGYSFVQRNYKPGFVNRVLLISDGLANVGLTDSNLIRLKVQQFKDQGITLSTFGVGLDYNERLLTDMAETGLGNYYFIDAPDKLTKLFEKELNGLLNVAVQNAELRIKLPEGIRIINGYPLKYTEVPGELVVSMRDLFSEETKATLFTFTIDNKINTPLKFLTTLTYTDVNDGQQKKLVIENLLRPVKNVESYLSWFNKPVIEQTILYTANQILENAMAQVDRGNFRSAQQLLDANRSYLRANSYYVDGDGELMQMDSLNTSYLRQSAGAVNLNADSLKRMQKSSRAGSYRARNKKQ